MATEFKRSVLASVPTSSIPNTSNTNNDLYTVPANCDTVVIGLLLTNKTGSGIREYFTCDKEPLDNLIKQTRIHITELG